MLSGLSLILGVLLFASPPEAAGDKNEASGTVPIEKLKEYPATAKMLAADRKLDNLSLSYQRVWRWHRSMARFGGEEPPGFPKDWVREGKSATTLTLRGQEMTFAHRPLDEWAGGIRLEMWSNVGGPRRRVTYRGSGRDKLDASWVEVEPPANDFRLPDGVTRMYWSFGVRYTPWIATVTSIECDGALTRVKGTLDYPKNGTTLFVLEVDGDGIVRRAELVIHSPKLEPKRVVISNTGKLETGELTFATHGEIRPEVPEWVSRLRGRCVGDEEFILEKVRTGLTDEEYRQLTNLEIPNNAYIRDAQEKVHKYRDADGKEQIIGPIKPSPPRNR
ncbi:MAG TPA: hypothetical protein PKC45_05255 [Gemmatales bacterium]|nr:hypothetical protein [Gemmatales bacterium]